MIRNILAIVAGYLFFSLYAVLYFSIAGIEPTNPPATVDLIVTAIFSSPAAFFSGWITSIISTKNSSKPIIILPILMALVAGTSIVAQPDTVIWTQLMTILLLAPLTYLGGSLANRGRR